MYSNKIFEIFKNPSNAGGLQGANGIGKYIDEVCGDFVKIYLKIDDSQKIAEARFKTMGSVGTIVASSIICSLVNGVTLAEAQELTAEDILKVTGEYPVDKMYSLDFAIRGLNLAIADYYQRIEKDEKPKRKKSDKAEKTSKAKKVANIEEDIYDDEEEEENTSIVGLLKTKQETSQQEQYVEETEKETASAEEVEEFEQDDLFEENDYSVDITSYPDEEEQPEADLSLDELADEEKDEDDEEDFYGDVAPYDDEEADDKPTTIYQDMPSNTLDPVDLFLRGGNDSDLEIHNLSNADRISITTTTEETVNIKATRMVEESRTYTPVIDTKIIKDEDMKNLTKETKKQDVDGDNKVSKAKAMFDAMFEE